MARNHVTEFMALAWQFPLASSTRPDLVQESGRYVTSRLKKVIYLFIIIFKADFDGKVMATHQLKNLLAVRPSTIWGYGLGSSSYMGGGKNVICGLRYADLDEASDEKVWPPQALAFGELVLVK